MKPALIIHGHFYQPPRENPWTESVDREPGARPFHDWNERIYQECYRPNGYARIIDGYGRIERIVNNYASISYNFGPTLLSWLEREHPRTYARVLEADRESATRRGGHGNAIAQGYNHSILPLCNERDRRTQVRWGLRDFQYRFGREAESMWLPETACDDLTLGALIDEGLRYVILSPHQAARVRLLKEGEWTSVNDGEIDTTRSYKYFHRDGTGRSIAVFFYEGSIAKGIAFDGALASSQGLVDRFERAANGRAASCVNVATDGETYGHHFHWGDRTLSYALEVEAPMRGFRITNYGEFLDDCPPEMEVEIKLGPEGFGTAWSCAHGVGRWSRDCGCQTGAQEGWNQAWRGPLRASLDMLRDEAAIAFEATAGELFADPWASRDDYIELIVDRHAARDGFLRRQGGRGLSASQKTRALTFLEMQRSAMTMYTSCGWFFADISGIEAQQVLKYAGRVLDFMKELGLPSPEARFLEILSEARSNIPRHGTGADIYRRFVEAARVTPERVAAHLGMSSLVDETAAEGETASYLYRRKDFQKQQHGRLTLSTEHLELEARATGTLYDYAVASMYFGDVDFYCVLRAFPGAQRFGEAVASLWAQFRAASVPSFLRLAQEQFGPTEYGLEHLLPAGRERTSEILFGQMVERFSEEYEFLYKTNRRNIEMLQGAGFELPTELRAAAEFTIGRRFEEEIRKHAQSQDASAYRKALEIANEVAQHGYRIDRNGVRRTFEEMIVRTVLSALAAPSTENVQTPLVLVKLARKLKLEANLEKAQEAVYEALSSGAVAAPAHEALHELASVLGLAPGLLLRRAELTGREDGLSILGDHTRVMI
jgi:alpha-amylase/alpha-mannosidase (GH57 family)